MIRIVEGRSMVNIIGTASELGYINIPDNTLIDIEQLKNYPDEQTVIITTGSQGESMAALSGFPSTLPDALPGLQIQAYNQILLSVALKYTLLDNLQL